MVVNTLQNPSLTLLLAKYGNVLCGTFNMVQLNSFGLNPAEIASFKIALTTSVDARCSFKL